MSARLGSALALLLSSAGPALAQNWPIPDAANPRIQTAVWHIGDIVRVRVSASSPLLIEFDQGEHVQSVSLGATRDWQVNVPREGTTLALRAVGQGRPTSMIVRTEQRTYIFDIQTGEQLAAALLRFVYPGAGTSPGLAPLDTGTGAQAAEAGQPAGAVQRYRLKGEKALMPDWIGDDGHKTFIYWNDEKAIPAVLALDEAGRELTIDGFMRGNYYTIDRVWPQLLFRIDRLVATATRDREGNTSRKKLARIQEAPLDSETAQVSDGQ